VIQKLVAFKGSHQRYVDVRSLSTSRLCCGLETHLWHRILCVVVVVVVVVVAGWRRPCKG